MIGKKKIKICDFNGAKLDVAIISDSTDAQKVFSRWKRKGLI